MGWGAVFAIFVSFCPFSFASDSVASDLDQLRAELHEYSLNSVSVGARPGSSFDRELELAALDPEIQSGEHVLYLASGHDLLRLMEAFPLVANYHLVDSFDSNPHQSVVQLVNQISTLPRASLIWGQSGFLLGDSDMPALIHLSFKSRTLGWIDRNILIHRIDPEDKQSVSRVIRGIPRGDSWAGFLCDSPLGIFLDQSLSEFMERASPKAAYVLRQEIKSPVSDLEMIQGIQETIGRRFHIQVLRQVRDLNSSDSWISQVVLSRRVPKPSEPCSSLLL